MSNDGEWDGIERRRAMIEFFAESKVDRNSLHKRLDDLETKLDEMIVMLKVGRAGLAFLKFVTATGAALAVIGTAIMEFFRFHK